MKQVIFLSFFFLTLPFTGMGQRDYIITLNRDTVYGEINWYSSGKITIVTPEGKKRYAKEEILGYKDAKRLYEVIKFTGKDGKATYMGMPVMVDGKVRLLLHCAQCRSYYIRIGDDCIHINKSSLKDRIIPRLSQCEKISLAYKDHTGEQLSKMARNYKKHWIIFPETL